MIQDMICNPFCKISEISLSRCELQADDVLYLSKALEKRFTLTSLNLSHNEIRDIGAAYLAPAFKTGVYILKSLDISYTHIGVRLEEFTRTIGSRRIRTVGWL